MQEISGVDALAVDTTARGFFRSARPAKDLKKDLTAALKKAKLKLKSLVLAKIKAPVEVYTIEVKGLG